MKLKCPSSFFLAVVLLLLFRAVPIRADKKSLIADFYSVDTFELSQSVGLKALQDPKSLEEIILDSSVGFHPLNNAIFFLGKLTYWGKFPLRRYQDILVTRILSMNSKGFTRANLETWKSIVSGLTDLYFKPGTNHGKFLNENHRYQKGVLSVLAEKRALGADTLDRLLTLLDAATKASRPNEAKRIRSKVNQILLNDVKIHACDSIVTMVFESVLAQACNLPTRTSFPKSFFDKKILGEN